MTGFTIPSLRTTRLTLRAFHPDDFAAYAAMLGDPAVARFLGTGQPRDPAESWEVMARALGQWAMRGYGLFAVEHAGRLIGHAGVLKPSNWPAPELAYMIASDAQGQGFATEAAAAVRDWAAAVHGLRELVSYIRPANAASIAVAGKLGARQEADIELLGIKAQVWRHGASAPPPAAGGSTTIDVPVLETARLRLRRFVCEDYAAICAIHADPATMRYMGDGKPRDPALTWAQMTMWTGMHAMRRGGWFAITRREDGAVIGRTGINAQPAWPEPEVAYTLARDQWGRGYAAEAAAAIRDWAWRTLAPATLVSLIKVGNAASANVARKLGARLTDTIEFEGKPTERWEYARPHQD
jgi:RimJ/RimL family protein N-acetyltransferase